MRIERSCKCGKSIQFAAPNRKWCSERCKYKHGHKKVTGGEKKAARKCGICGKPEMMRPGQLYCGKVCQSHAHYLARKARHDQQKATMEADYVPDEETIRREAEAIKQRHLAEMRSQGRHVGRDERPSVRMHERMCCI